MDIFQLKIEASGWYIIPCLLLAAAYAYFLYKNKEPFTQPVRYLLGGLRFLIVFLICFLLLSPYINYTKNTYEKPVIAVVVDNSSSVTMEQSADYEKQIRAGLATSSTRLTENEIEVAFFDLNNKTPLDSLQFTNDETNLSAALKEAEGSFYNQNLAAIVLVSDGVVNRGPSPDYLTLQTPIYTLGLGDTTLQKDLLIHEIKTNKTAYVNNSFPIETTIHNTGYAGQKIKVDLVRKDSLIQQKELTLNKAGFQKLAFYVSEKQAGVATYSIRVTELDDEITLKNNTKKTYIEIVNNKKKILLYALAPHPDIKFIRQLINKLDRYEFELHIEGLTKKPANAADYNLIIAYQVPAIGKTSAQTNEILNSKTPKLFIVGNQTDLRTFSNNNKTLSIIGNNNQKDEVNAYLKTSFDKFKTDDNYIQELLAIVPPIAVPFADFNVKGNTEGLLYQQVGSIKTDKPLLMLQHTNDFKEGVLVGEGYWKWTLFEYAEKQEHKLLNELLSKTIQFLISTDDKRKLLVTPNKQDFYTSEIADFKIQTLNDLYEPISNVPVKVSISKNGESIEEFNYVSDEFSQSFPMKRLNEGNYQYTAQATISDKIYRMNGAFTVKKKHLEELGLRANHTLLKTTAQNNRGKFYSFDRYIDLVDELVSQNFKKVIHSQETNKPLRENWWYLILIVSLLTAEWILRKVKGSQI